MKKFMIAAAAVASFTALADIQSANVVGYFQKEQLAFDPVKTTVVFPTGIITFQWNKVDGSVKKLNEILKCNVAVQSWDPADPEAEDPMPGWYNNAPKLQVRDAGGSYTVLYYTSNAWDEENECDAEGWADKNGMYESKLTVSLGQGAWFSSPVEPATLTIAGAVATMEMAVGGDTSGASLLCGGSFPVAFQVNDTNKVTWTCTAVQSWDPEDPEAEDPVKGWELNAPKIQVRDVGGSYTVLYYTSNAWDEENECDVQGWADKNGMLDTFTTVQVGGGFWLSVPETVPGGNRSVYLTVKNPLAK